MTRLLKEAFRKAQELPEEDQNALVASILAKLEYERRWRRAFEASPYLLANMAEEAFRAM